jgi:UDP-GlcNAc:undecaprenyl-phosphate/decaprenyl-phosphate GlcNAc-1-phosphate transferase
VTARRPWRSPALAALAAAVIERVAAAALRRRPPGGVSRWTRTNHRGEPISLLEGPAVVLGALAGVSSAPGLAPRTRAAAVVAVAAAGALGAYDDLAEGGVRKGLKGHLGALARGEVTTGAVKVVGLAAAGLAASAVVRSGDADQTGTSRLLQGVDVLVGGAVVAGAANLLNLLDLRPGRALKAVLLSAPVQLRGGGAPLAAALAGSALTALADDLGERTMLGDTGANAAGAMLGVAALTASGPAGRWRRAAALTGLVALTAASEKVSFTRVIESTPGLRELDALGRRPAGSPT